MFIYCRIYSYYIRNYKFVNLPTKVYINEKEKVFSEIARVLKPGGRMVVSDIVAEDFPEWMYENKKLYRSCVSGAISEKKYL